MSANDADQPIPRPPPTNNNSTSRAILTAKEIKSFMKRKKLVIEDYAKYFGSCASVLWSNMSEHKHASIGNASFQGLL